MANLLQCIASDILVELAEAQSQKVGSQLLQCFNFFSGDIGAFVLLEPKDKENHRLALFVASRVRALPLLPRPGMATRFFRTPPPISASMRPSDISVTAKQSADSVSSVLRIHREN
jgi:hypothetical protein